MGEKPSVPRKGHGASGTSAGTRTGISIPVSYTHLALEKPICKAEKAAARADKAQANIPKKKVRQTVIDPDTGKKTSKLTFEDKKKPPSKVSQGVKEAPVQLIAGKLHKEIREKMCIRDRVRGR